MNEGKEFVVSALKFRPQTLSEVTGQEHITETLKNAIRRNRLAHAYLFCGPRGVGKTSTARILAKAMNCDHLRDGEPCNECETCRSITQGRCLDVLELDAASNRGIDEVRDLRENVRFAPSTCKVKVYIIDEAHQLTREAFNALLKTLEEPPPHAKFILATTEAEKMPETIVSRCQQYRFKPLSLQQIVENLRRIVHAHETVPIPENILEETLFLIAKTSDGGMRDAQSLFDQVMSLADETLTLEEVELVLGGVRLDTLLSLTEAVHHREVARALELVQTCYNQGQDMTLLVRDLLEHFRNLMVCKTAPSFPDLIDLPQDQVKRIAEQSAQLTLEDLLQGIDLLFEAERRLKTTNNPRAVCEAVVIKLATMPTTVEIEALLGRGDVPIQPLGTKAPGSEDKPVVKTDAPEKGNNPRFLKSKSPSPEHSSAPSEATGTKTRDKPVEKAEKTAKVLIRMDESPEQDVLDTLLEKWPAICHRLVEVEMHIGGYLNDAVPKSYANNTLQLVVPEHLTLHFTQLNTPQSKEALRDVLEETVGISPNIEVVTGTQKEVADLKPPLRDDDIPMATRGPSIEEIVESEPNVKEILDAFDGTVIDIRNNPNT